MMINLLNCTLLVVALLLIYVYFKSKHEVYLDNNGTTKPYKIVADEIKKACNYGNASGIYASKAKGKLHEFRAKIKDIMRLPNHYVVITSGASESNNMIIRCMVDKWWAQHKTKPNVIASEVEHKTTLMCLDELKMLGRCTYDLAPVDRFGRCLRGFDVKPNTCLVTIMHVNNETGCINDIGHLAQDITARGIHFHSDLAQSFGKIKTVGELPPNLPNTSYSISMHKTHCGNLGCLIVDPDVLQLDGHNLSHISGMQNDGLRGGTENIPQVSGALEGLKIHKFNVDKSLIGYLTKQLSIDVGPLISLEQCLDSNDAYKNLDRAIIVLSAPESCSTLLFSVVGNKKYCNIKLRQKLLDAGFVVSIGSTCNTNVKGASHVLLACGVPEHIRSGVLRVSTTHDTKKQDLHDFSKCLGKILSSEDVS